MTEERKPRKARDTSLASVDREAPAYKIIYGVFGGLTPFCNATGTNASTAHLWLRNGIIPESPGQGGRYAHIIECAAALGKKLDPAMFVRLSNAA